MDCFVVNAVAPAKRLRQAAQAVATAVTTKQSMGGEDFGWYLDHVPGAMARLGVRRPGWSGPVVDLHQASFDLDEAALATGSGVLVRTALDALHARDTDV
jgi:metal-dependent amidase/aminoacylase/carboxypeptidase family protein